MKSKDLNTGWLSGLINWIKGESTLQDERALEEMARQDEFLADALEGYRKFPEENHTAAIHRMKAQLRKRTNKRGLVFYAVRIAAAVVFLAVAWIAIQPILKNSDDTSISMMEVQEESPKNVQEPEKLQTEEVAEVSPVESEKRNLTFPKKKLETVSSTKSIEKDLALVEQTAPPAPTVQQSHIRSSVETLAFKAIEKPIEDKAIAFEPAKSAAIERATEQDARRVAPNAMIFEAQAGAIAVRKINGKVSDESGEPIIGATVLLKGTNKGTVTDMNGNFNLEVNGPASITVNYLGYQTREIPLSEITTYQIRLSKDPAAELSEVVVTGYGNKKAKSRSEAPKPPEPVNGLKKFEKYLNESLKYPASAIANDISGEVKVQFRVLPDGSLTDFIVVDSLGHGCDEEAIRLLKEGPKWSPAGIQTYSIQFKLK